MTPDTDEVRQILGYILAVCIEEYGIQLHSACFMSNHYHLDVTDVHGNLPAFKCKLNSNIAKAMNAYRGRFDQFWSGDPPCDVELTTDDDVIDRMAYTLANPVAATAIPRAARWPGLTTAGVSFETSLRFARPNVYMDPENESWPESVELRIVRPKVLLEHSDETFEKMLGEKVRALETQAQARVRKEHRRFQGESRIRRQKWNRPPRTLQRRFELRPRFAASSKWARLAALQRNEEWEREYGTAYEEWLDGGDPTFPPGTYALARFSGARVAPPD